MNAETGEVAGSIPGGQSMCSLDHGSIREASAGPGVGSQRVFVGIDLGYRSHVACACTRAQFIPADDRGGQLRWKRAGAITFSSDAAGFGKLQAYLDQQSKDAAAFLIVMEPTGGYYGLALQMYLLSRKYAVLQVGSRSVKEYREKLYGSETKTDHDDARLLARMAFLHETVGEEYSLHVVQFTTSNQATLRMMVRDYVHLQREIGGRLNQIQQLLAASFPELKTFFVHRMTGRAARALLDRYRSPSELAAAEPETVAKLLREAHAFGHAKRAEELVALARGSVGVHALGYQQWRLDWLLDQLPGLEQARSALLAQIEAALVSHPYTSLIDSLPVHGTIWTATLIAIIGDVHRFRTYAQFRAYMGWFPKVSQSGTSRNSSRLANSGVRDARRVLGQMTLILISGKLRTNPFREYHLRLVGAGMRRGVSVGHVAGKLATVIYSLLKNGKTYDADYHRRQLTLPTSPALDPPAINEVADEHLHSDSKVPESVLEGIPT